MVLHALHLCSGYGGFELALRLAGVPARTVAHVERDAYAAATLVARMEDQTLDLAPVWSDLLTFPAGEFAGRVDLVTAGFPCQPFSAAGARGGVDDERWLWPAIGRIVRDVGPRFVFLENVPGLVRAGLPHVLSDLARLGFDAEWGLHSAAEAGAPHRRDRWWLLAALGDSCGSGRPEVARGAPGDERTYGRRSDGGHVADGAGEDAWPPARDDRAGWERWIAAGGPEPAVRRNTDGPPAGLADALHLGGNGLVPAVAARALVELARRLGVDLWGES